MRQRQQLALELGLRDPAKRGRRKAPARLGSSAPVASTARPFVPFCTNPGEWYYCACKVSLFFLFLIEIYRKEKEILLSYLTDFFYFL